MVLKNLFKIGLFLPDFINLAENQPMNTAIASGKSFNGRPSLRGKATAAEAIQKQSPLEKRVQKAAFSLVEMLMALLVASLLMAALAPVMTKRMNEAKINISGVGAAQYDKDAIVTIFTKSDTFNVPNDVNAIKVTMIGGGGAGGNAAFGKQEVTSSGEWTVPSDITKLRIFMIGGGGGGASGGKNTGIAFVDSDTDTGYKDFLNEGETKFSLAKGVTKIPEMDERCTASGVTKWTSNVDNATEYTPNTDILAKVTACGGGGGMGYANIDEIASGGSGGYVTNIPVTLPTTPTTIYIKVGGAGGSSGSGSGWVGGYGGGGGGASGYNLGSEEVGYTRTGAEGGTFGGRGGSARKAATATAGGNGTTKKDSSNNDIILANGGDRGSAGSFYGGKGGNGGVWGGGGGGGGAQKSCTGGGGGGGGGPTTITTKSGADGEILFQIGGGGGGGGTVNCGTNGAGGGGGGGGYGGGGGGGGGGTAGCGVYGQAAGFLSQSIGIGNGNNGASAVSGTEGYPDKRPGGYGGGGYGGVRGALNRMERAAGVGRISTIFNGEYCHSGCQGALRLYYTYPPLKCTYNDVANGGGGGGAGQITIGEITVTPGEKLYFEIGAGGGSQSAYGKNGNAGKPTYIRRGGAGGAIIATALGGNAGTYSATGTSFGGTLHPVSILDKNWTEKEYKENAAGGAGGLKTATTGGYGGSGASSLDLKGNILQGGTGGNTAKNGVTPLANHYGAGGGGGSGAQSIGDLTAGLGAAGVSGYIYLEYGGSNGGGGTAGEIVTKLITNIKAGIEIPVTVGTGGKAAGSGNGEASKFGTYLTAKGGIKGQNGGMDVGANGGVTLLPADYKNYSKDEAATQNGQAATPTYGGIGGYLEALYENADGTFASYIKAKDGTIGGPVVGGCGGNLTTLMSGIICNDAANTPNGKNGTFGGGGGGGAVINETGGIGGNGGDGVVILEYKSVSI